MKPLQIAEAAQARAPWFGAALRIIGLPLLIIAFLAALALLGGVPD